MLDLPRMQRIRLSSRPLAQRALGAALLVPNYRLPPRINIEVHGREHLPDEPIIYAMNHTDRYNYWPFQYWLWRELDRFTATWVKGKYYENWLVGRILERTNNIPAPSLGYVLGKDFALTVGRPPDPAEYRSLRQLAGGEAVAPEAIPELILRTPRNMLGRAFDPARESYAECLRSLMADLNARFVELNEECFARGLDLLVFPQGTRSIRLSRGHIGLAQVAFQFRRPVVPVGCSGSDRLYPGNRPWARGGTVIYRIGDPITAAELERHRPPGLANPFTAQPTPVNREAMQRLVDEVMERINDLVDPEYQFADDQAGDGCRDRC